MLEIVSAVPFWQIRKQIIPLVALYRGWKVLALQHDIYFQRKKHGVDDTREWDLGTHKAGWGLKVPAVLSQVGTGRLWAAHERFRNVVHENWTAPTRLLTPQAAQCTEAIAKTLLSSEGKWFTSSWWLLCTKLGYVPRATISPWDIRRQPPCLTASGNTIQILCYPRHHTANSTVR